MDTKHKLWAANDELRIGGVRRIFRRRMLVRMGVLLLLVFALTMPVTWFVVKVAPIPLQFAIELLLFLGLMYVAARSMIDLERDAIVEVFKRHSLCPCCGYALDSIEPGADALTVCPECGAAWRLPNGGTPLPRRE